MIDSFKLSMLYESESLFTEILDDFNYNYSIPTNASKVYLTNYWKNQDKKVYVEYNLLLIAHFFWYLETYYRLSKSSLTTPKLSSGISLAKGAILLFENIVRLYSKFCDPPIDFSKSIA